MRTPVLVILVALAALGAAFAAQPPAASANPLTGIVAVSAGGSQTCVITAAGGAKCWGYNTFGQLGDGTQTHRTTPVDVVGLESGVTAVAAGRSHSCALTTAGGVKCWGDDSFDALGVPPHEVDQCPDPTFSTWFPCSTTPIDVTGLQGGVAAVAAGSYHTCVITNAGGVKCWGKNYAGQLGDGTTTRRDVPVDVAGLSSSAVALALGFDYTCALMMDSNVQCWGSNSADTLGTASDETCYIDLTGTPIPCSTTPLEVCQIPGESGGTCLAPLSGIAAVTASGVHACALTTASAVKCWGGNEHGELGDGLHCGIVCRAPVDVCADATCTAPLSGVTSVAAGVLGHTCVATSAGSAKCWGTNFFGELGNGTGNEEVLVFREMPVEVCRTYDNKAQQCLEPLSGVFSIDAGATSSCALMSAGNVKCWGTRTGDGTLERRQVPVDVLVTPKPTPTATSTATATATPTVTPFATPTATIALPPGDADCDGSLTSIDAALVLQLVASLLSSLPCQTGADLNGDGAINAVDAALILQHVAGFIIPDFGQRSGMET